MLVINNKLRTPAPPKKKRSTHVKAEVYGGSGDFTIANWMYYLNLCHSAVNARTKTTRYRRGIPPSDGSSPWTWKPETAFECLKTLKPKTY